MLRRYLSLIVVIVLTALLLAAAARGFILLDRAKKQAHAVTVATLAFDQPLQGLTQDPDVFRR